MPNETETNRVPNGSQKPSAALMAVRLAVATVPWMLVAAAIAMALVRSGVISINAMPGYVIPMAIVTGLATMYMVVEEVKDHESN